MVFLKFYINLNLMSIAIALSIIQLSPSPISQMPGSLTSYFLTSFDEEIDWDLPVVDEYGLYRPPTSLPFRCQCVRT